MKKYKIAVKVMVSATFIQEAGNAEEAIKLVKDDINCDNFDLALLTDYDMKNAKVMYVGEPSKEVK